MCRVRFGIVKIMNNLIALVMMKPTFRLIEMSKIVEYMLIKLVVILDDEMFECGVELFEDDRIMLIITGR